MRKIALPMTFACALIVVAAGCQTAPQTQASRSNLQEDAQASLKRFERSDDTLADILRRAPGYTIFPSVGKGGFIVGGAYGKGVLYQNNEPIGYSDMTAASVGFQAGGQDFSELIVFEDDAALNRFKDKGGYGLSLEASAVAVKPGAAARAQFKQGVMVFSLINGGLMGEAAVAGQKFRFRSMDDVDTTYDRDVRTAGQRSEGTYRRPTNTSVGASVSTPDGDTGVTRKSNISGDSSISTPNGDKTRTTEKSIQRTPKDPTED